MQQKTENDNMQCSNYESVLEDAESDKSSTSSHKQSSGTESSKANKSGQACYCVSATRFVTYSKLCVGFVIGIYMIIT